jgi:hypothetical protein
MTGLEYIFLLFLIPLLAAGLLPLTALRTYPRDRATARASVRAVQGADRRDGTTGGRTATELVAQRRLVRLIRT